MCNLTKSQERVIKRAKAIGMDLQIILNNLHLSDKSLAILIKAYENKMPSSIIRLCMEEKTFSYLNELCSMCKLCGTDEWGWFSLDYTTSHFKYFATHPDNWRGFLDPTIKVVEYKLLELYMAKGLDKEFIKFVIIKCDNYTKTEILLQAKLDGLDIIDLLDTQLTPARLVDALSLRNKGINPLNYPIYLGKGYGNLMQYLDEFTVGELEKALSLELSINRILVCHKILKDWNVDVYDEACKNNMTTIDLQNIAEMAVYEKRYGKIECELKKEHTQTITWREQGIATYKKKMNIVDAK